MPIYREEIKATNYQTSIEKINLDDTGEFFLAGSVSDKFIVKTPVFHYPLEVADMDNSALLRFVCVEPPAVELKSFIKQTTSFLTALADQVKEILGPDAKLWDEAVLPRLLAGESIQDILGIEGINDVLPEVTEPLNTAGNEAPIGEVVMYLPPSIIVPDNFDYGSATLGTVGGFAEGALAGGNNSAVGAGIQGITNAATSIISGILGNGSQNSTNNASVAGAVAASALLGGNDGLAGAIKGSTRLTVNPNTRTLFNNVNIREFSFDFQFVPRSQSEAIEIAAIIQFFRTEAYPELLKYTTDNGLEIPFGYKFPNAWDISAIWGGQQIKGLDFQRSYLRNVSTTYNPTQIGMYEDGSFNEIRMTLTFVETRPLDKQKVKDHYGGPEYWTVLVDPITGEIIEDEE